MGRVERGRLVAPWLRCGSFLSFPISPVMVKAALARIAPAATAIGPPSPTAHRLVNASVGDNTRRAYAGALRRLAAGLAGLWDYQREADRERIDGLPGIMAAGLSRQRP